MRGLRELSRVLGARAFSSVPAGEVAIATGLPSLAGRKAFITAPAKTAGQHGIMLTADSECRTTDTGPVRCRL